MRADSKCCVNWRVHTERSCDPFVQKITIHFPEIEKSETDGLEDQERCFVIDCRFRTESGDQCRLNSWIPAPTGRTTMWLGNRACNREIINFLHCRSKKSILSRSLTNIFFRGNVQTSLPPHISDVPVDGGSNVFGCKKSFVNILSRFRLIRNVPWRSFVCKLPFKLFYEPGTTTEPVVEEQIDILYNGSKIEIEQPPQAVNTTVPVL